MCIRDSTHTHTIRVISGLAHVYFLTFARFLNGKCRNPHQRVEAGKEMCIRDRLSIAKVYKIVSDTYGK